jgi:hypothetical protein
VACLLSSNPLERKMIYQMWGIENKESHYLQPVLRQKAGTVNSPSNQTSYNRTSKFQFPPSPHRDQATLQFVPSETILVPSLPLSNHHSTLQQPLSTRSNPARDSAPSYNIPISFQNSYDDNKRLIPQYQSPTFQASSHHVHPTSQQLPLRNGIQIPQNYGLSAAASMNSQQLP